MNAPTLSICIPTYNRADLLQQVLDHLEFIKDFPYGTEVVVSDNASDDHTCDVIRSKQGQMPGLRYFRQRSNLGAERNVISALRAARGDYAVYLADDDRLVPENLRSIIDFLEQHAHVGVCHSPWEIWDEQKQTGRPFYRVDRLMEFDQSRGLKCFNFVVNNGVFPEIAVYRTSVLWKIAYLPKRTFLPFVWLFKALRYGSVCFHPLPFYRSILRQDGGVSGGVRGQAGHGQCVTHLDQYRAGLEAAFFMAIENHTPLPLPDQIRAQGMEAINAFVCGRLEVASRLSGVSNDWISANEFHVRQMLWQRRFDRNTLTAWETQVVPRAAFQAVTELFEECTALDTLVVCGFAAPDQIVAGLRSVRPDIQVEVRTEEEVLDTDDRERVMVLIEQEETRRTLVQRGLPPGFVLLYQDIVNNFRILPRTFREVV